MEESYTCLYIIPLAAENVEPAPRPQQQQQLRGPKPGPGAVLRQAVKLGPGGAPAAQSVRGVAD